MQVECIRPFGTSVPGDLAEVPDGAEVDRYHWRKAGGWPEADEGAAAPGPPGASPAASSAAPALSPVPVEPAQEM